MEKDHLSIFYVIGNSGIAQSTLSSSYFLVDGVYVTQMEMHLFMKFLRAVLQEQT